MRISHEHQSQKEKIKENKEKIKLNKTLPYLVSNVIEVIFSFLCLPVNLYNHNSLIFYWFQILDIDPQGDEEEGANVDLDSQRKGKCAVIKTSTRQVSFFWFFFSFFQINFHFFFIKDLFSSGNRSSWAGRT